MRVASYRLTYLCVIGWVAVIDGRNYNQGGNYFGLIHKNFGSLSPPHCS